MRQQNYAISAYQAAIRTIPPLQAVVMLYDGILAHIAKAEKAAERRDYETQFNEIILANKIISGLSGCLDMEQGGTVAVSLREMYQSVSKALYSSVGRKTGALCCRKIAAGLRLTRDAWAEIAGMPLLAPQDVAEPAQDEVEP